MGEPRFQKLEAMLPDDATIIGIDEHTACIIDLNAQQIYIQGIGNITIRKMGHEKKFGKKDRISIEALVKEINQRDWTPQDLYGTDQGDVLEISEADITSKINKIKTSFQDGLANHDQKEMTNALLELDSIIWKAQNDLEDEERLSEAREIFRDFIVILGAELGISHHHLRKYLSPIVEQMLQLRARFRNEKKWSEADLIRDILQQSNIQVEDTKDGVRWQIADEDTSGQ